MRRLDWLSCWDELRAKLSERTTWERAQIIEEMDKIEKRKIRELKQEGSGCLCKGFYKPVNCPVHGRESKPL